MYEHHCSQQCRSMRRKASWYQSPGDAPCLRVSIFPWLLFFVPSLVLSNGVLAGLLHSSLWLSPLTQFRKKAYLVQKGGGSWESVFL